MIEQPQNDTLKSMWIYVWYSRMWPMENIITKIISHFSDQKQKKNNSPDLKCALIGNRQNTTNALWPNPNFANINWTSRKTNQYLNIQTFQFLNCQMNTLIIKKKQKNYKDIFNWHLLNALKMRSNSTKAKSKPNTVYNWRSTNSH